MDEIQPRLLRDEVYDLIWRRIMSGELKPGDRIVESRLASQLAVSQTPVREAVQQMVREGLLVTLARFGTFVRELDAHDIRDVYSVREALESVAMSAVLLTPIDERDTSNLEQLYESMLEAAAADDGSRLVEFDMRFHKEIVRLSGNQALPDVMGPLLSQTAAFISITNLVYFDSLRAVAETHLPLLTLAQHSSDAESGRSAVRDHLAKIWELVASSETPPPEDPHW